MINGRTRLHVVVNGTITGQRYIDEVLLPHVRLFRGADGDKFAFMDDNATYLNPIENVWDALGRQVAGRNYPPTNINTLIRALTEEWDKLPQQLLDNVVQKDSAFYIMRRMPAQLSSLSLNHGSKLRGPAPKAHIELNSVTEKKPLTYSFYIMKCLGFHNIQQAILEKEPLN
ncbi:hypothetical protein TNCV_2667101 [Trichonephila clavipes]|nr:hypothetical protein TNCV_2667101 [Trichonephila clavipes]